MYVLHLSVDCQGCFFVRLVWRFKYMIDVQREYIYESQDCTTRYQYNRTNRRTVPDTRYQVPV
jgi:hypothetical protein